MHAIELKDARLTRDERVVLANVDLAITPGEFIGVFGPNGSGKTTLLHAILGLLRPAAGTIKVFGQSPTRGNRHAGYLPQQHSAVADLRLRGWDLVASAYRGERWGLPLVGAEGKAEIDWALDMVEARSLATRAICELSGGELQRLLLAQTLLGKPRLLLLDEPLVNLDPRFQRSIIAVVKQIQQTLGVTVLFTAHDLNPLLGAMNRVLYLGNGHAALGTVDEVVTTEVLSQLYDAPIDVYHIDNRIIVVSGHGPVDIDAHLHDHDV